jgi:hypothetical protein
VRWPWQPRPGMVRVSSRRLIALQRTALAVAELEAEARALAAETALLRAQNRAFDLLESRAEEGVAVERPVVDLVLADLPLTSDGRLHEAAFEAWVEDRVWAQRAVWLAEMTSSGE